MADFVDFNNLKFSRQMANIFFLCHKNRHAVLNWPRLVTNLCTKRNASNQAKRIALYFPLETMLVHGTGGKLHFCWFWLTCSKSSLLPVFTVCPAFTRPVREVVAILATLTLNYGTKTRSNQKKPFTLFSWGVLIYKIHERVLDTLINYIPDYMNCAARLIHLSRTYYSLLFSGFLFKKERNLEFWKLPLQ